eukprot:12881924-Alexandrium_andersonii.AAC.1
MSNPVGALRRPMESAQSAANCATYALLGSVPIPVGEPAPAHGVCPAATTYPLLGASPLLKAIARLNAKPCWGCWGSAPAHGLCPTATTHALLGTRPPQGDCRQRVARGPRPNPVGELRRPPESAQLRAPYALLGARPPEVAAEG